MSNPVSHKELLESLYKQYHPMVLQMCLGYMKGDHDLAKDIVQEVFINIWNALSGFKGEASHKTWIYRITVNTCLLYLRSSKRPEKTALQDVGEPERLELVEREKDEHQALYSAIGELPQLDRLIIMMVLEELEYDEISKITGISSINLRVKIHRAKKKMREHLNKRLYG